MVRYKRYGLIGVSVYIININNYIAYLIESTNNFSIKILFYYYHIKFCFIRHNGQTSTKPAMLQLYLNISLHDI